MFTTQDFDMLASEMGMFFDNLPQEPNFHFIWKKAHLTPKGTTYDLNPTWEDIPGLMLPHVAERTVDTPEGKVVVQDVKSLCVPKKWGETVTVNDITYVGGIQVHDRLRTYDGLEYRVIAKESRGLGAYWVLSLIEEEGINTNYLRSQY